MEDAEEDDGEYEPSLAPESEYWETDQELPLEASGDEGETDAEGEEEYEVEEAEEEQELAPQALQKV